VGKEADKLLHQKPRPHVGSWHHALFLFAEPPVPVFGNEIVNGISDGAGNESEEAEVSPRTAEVFEGLHGGIRFGVNVAVAD